MSKIDVEINFIKWNDVKNIKSAVYVMGMVGEDHMSGIYKVGRVDRTVGSLERRVMELERPQWVIPGSLKVIAVIETGDPATLEGNIHDISSMARTRLSNRRELFKRNINEIFADVKVLSRGLASKIYVLEDAAKHFGLEYKLNNRNYKKCNNIVNTGYYEFRYEFRDKLEKFEFKVIGVNKKGIIVEYNNTQMSFTQLKNITVKNRMDFNKFKHNCWKIKDL